MVVMCIPYFNLKVYSMFFDNCMYQQQKVVDVINSEDEEVKNK